MPDLVNGLPLHPLVVHAVVVLLPLSILGTLALVVRPAWRLRYGWLVVGCAALATAVIPLATATGEALAEQVPQEPREHAELGEQLIWFAIPLLLVVAALVYLEHRKASGRPAIGPSFLPGLVAVLAVVAALATGVQVYRVGDSGARATWEKVATSDGG